MRRGPVAVIGRNSLEPQVDVRGEGPTRTLVEQGVTVDVRPFGFSDRAKTYECDGTRPNVKSPSPTRSGTPSDFGGCAATITPGDDILFPALPGGAR